MGVKSASTAPGETTVLVPVPDVRTDTAGESVLDGPTESTGGSGSGSDIKRQIIAELVNVCNPDPNFDIQALADLAVQSARLPNVEEKLREVELEFLKKNVDPSIIRKIFSIAQLMQAAQRQLLLGIL